MTKYAGLTTFLHGKKADEVEMTFKDHERVVFYRGRRK